MDNLEIYYKKAAQQLRSGEALFGKPKSVIRDFLVQKVRL